ncbi:MAG: c-type cytochrome [Bdellovibrionota bacterium]|nr:MAG: c-type cytochrome [Bdellovibrionota bacterium]
MCRLCVVVAALVLASLVREAQALPFNDDMVKGQNMQAGTMMRAKAKGSVPLGASARFQGTRMEARALPNPVQADARSLAAGKRLYEVNCLPCHGSYQGAQHSPGAVAQWLPGPALGAAMYTNQSAYPDGYFYEFIHFGGMALMPAYGYKLSETEHWDIVNYIRELQAQVAKK